MITRILTNASDPLVDGSGNPLVNTLLEFFLVDEKGKITYAWDVEGKERIAPGPVRVYTDENGEFSVPLWPTSRGDKILYWLSRVASKDISDVMAPLTEGIGDVQWADWAAGGTPPTPAQLNALAAHLANAALHFRWRDAWDAETDDYLRYDAVSHGGSSWKAKQDVPAGTEPEEGDYWTCIAAKGDNSIVPGPANTLTKGAVTTGAPGSAADFSIIGDAPNQTLNLTIPQGLTGNPYKGYDNLAAATADLANIPADALIWVNADVTGSNNGFYTKTGGVLVISTYGKDHLRSSYPLRKDLAINSSHWINEAIIDIQISGATAIDLTQNYWIRYISKNTNGVKQVSINWNDGVEHTLCVGTINPFAGTPAGVERYTLSQYGGNGISGYVLINWDKVPAGNSTLANTTNSILMHACYTDTSIITALQNKTQKMSAAGVYNDNAPFTLAATFDNSGKAVLRAEIFNADVTKTYHIGDFGYDAGSGWYVINIMQGANVVAVWNSKGYPGRITGYTTIWVNPTNNFHEFARITVDFSKVAFAAYVVAQTALRPENINAGLPVEFIKGDTLMSQSVVISEATDLYAHDHQAVRYGTKVYIPYQYNAVTAAESAASQSAKLAIYDTIAGTTIYRTIATAGETYGTLTIAAGAKVWLPRAYIIGGALRCFFHYSNKTYYRDLNLTTNTFGNATEFLATIHGGGAAVSLTPANIVSHIDGATGTTFAYPSNNNIAFVLRDDDQPRVHSNGDWSLMGECTAEFTGNAGSGGSWPVLLKSTDQGATWTLMGVCYKSVAPAANNYVESAHFVMADDSIIVYMRQTAQNHYYYAKSTDGGATFTSIVQAVFDGLGTRCGLAQTDDGFGTKSYFIAYNKRNHCNPEGHRTTLAVAKSSDGINFTDVAVLENPSGCHYPSLFEWNRLASGILERILYMTFTTGEKNLTTNARDTVRITKMSAY